MKKKRTIAHKKTAKPGTVKPSLGFIGAGNMAEALIHGLLRAKAILPNKIIASRRSPELLASLKKKYKIHTTTKNLEVVAKAKVIILGVKPKDIAELALEIRDAVSNSQLIISLGAGITTRKLRELFGPRHKFIRSMPNSPALVGCGVTGLYPSDNVSPEELAMAKDIFNTVGIVNVVDDEGLLDLITGLCGSGPAYVFYFIEAMTDAAIKEGFDREQALALAAQTVYGAARLVIETGEPPLELRRKVSSPGGTTIEGVKALEEGLFGPTIYNAIKAAQQRSRDMALNL